MLRSLPPPAEARGWLPIGRSSSSSLREFRSSSIRSNHSSDVTAFKKLLSFCRRKNLPAFFHLPAGPAWEILCELCRAVRREPNLCREHCRQFNRPPRKSWLCTMVFVHL